MLVGGVRRLGVWGGGGGRFEVGWVVRACAGGEGVVVGDGDGGGRRSWEEGGAGREEMGGR